MLVSAELPADVVKQADKELGKIILSDFHMHLGFLSAEARTDFYRALDEHLEASALTCKQVADPHHQAAFTQRATSEQLTVSPHLPEAAHFYSCTLCAQEFEEMHTQGHPQVHWGLGLHPQRIASLAPKQLKKELTAYITCLEAQQPAFIGEIGLDFRESYKKSAEAQICCLKTILEALKHQGRSHLLSVHAVQSVHNFLDMIEHIYPQAQLIFHWFSGNSEELSRARKKGCWFSVGYRMLKSKRGQAYAQAIEPDRLLLETDDPPYQIGSPAAAEKTTQVLELPQLDYNFTKGQAHLFEALQQLSWLKKMPQDKLLAQIKRNEEDLRRRCIR